MTDRCHVVIPAYRAGSTLGGVLEELGRALPEAAVVVVDDGSDDDTDAVGRRGGAVVLRHESNRGKGAALRRGIAHALSRDAATILTLDADGQHPPQLAPALLSALAQADLVIGARSRTGGMPPHRRFTNSASSAALSRITGVPISDAQSGFRAFRRAVAERTQPSSNGYEYETEFLVLAARAGFRISSVPVPTIYAGRSHFRLLQDGARVVRTIWALRR